MLVFSWTVPRIRVSVQARTGVHIAREAAVPILFYFSKSSAKSSLLKVSGRQWITTNRIGTLHRWWRHLYGHMMHKWRIKDANAATTSKPLTTSSSTAACSPAAEASPRFTQLPLKQPSSLTMPMSLMPIRFCFCRCAQSIYSLEFYITSVSLPVTPVFAMLLPTKYEEDVPV